MPQIGRRGRQPIMGADAGRGGGSMQVGVKGGKRWTKKSGLNTSKYLATGLIFYGI